MIYYPVYIQLGDFLIGLLSFTALIVSLIILANWIIKKFF